MLPDEGARAGPGPIDLSDLPIAEREVAVPLVLDAFTGIYRWHAKRTLRDVARVRVARLAGREVGLAMLDPLVPEVGYLYYLIVLREFQGRGIGGRLVDDALDRFREDGRSVVYVATGLDNAPMVRLLQARGFRTVGRTETGYREGGLGAWGLRSRMRIVPGEVLFGLRFTVGAPPPGGTGPAATVKAPGT